MAAKPEDRRQHEAGDRHYKCIRWLGPLYAIYKIVREFLAH